jgi:hypothetical protein
MNEYEKLPEWIVRFNNNELRGRELEDFLEMIKYDPDVRQEVKLDQELNEILSDTEILELRKKIAKNKYPKERDPRIMPLIFLAASMTILLTLGTLAFIHLRKEQKEILIAIEKTDPENLYKNFVFPDSAEIAKDRQALDSATLSMAREMSAADRILMTENFRNYPPFELLIGESMRSVGFKLVKPVSSDKFKRGDTVIFRWETDSQDPITITITDNRGNTFFSSRPLYDKDLFYPTTSLKEGLYYVKFIRNDEIIYFDKLLLK